MRGDDAHHRDITESFVKWCEANYLELNVLNEDQGASDRF